MSSYTNQYQYGSAGRIPSNAPPPPMLKNLRHQTTRTSRRHNRFSVSRSRSRSPESHRRQVSAPHRINRVDNLLSAGYGGVRDKKPHRRSRSRSAHVSSSATKEEPTSSSSYPTYVRVVEDSHHRPTASHLQQISRIPPVDPNDNAIVRTILNPESVKIPRRENEGLKPIFDRDELREAMKRRIETGDNDKNPNHPEQRVVAIIREPLPMPQQFVQQEMIPILPTQYMPTEDIIQKAPIARFETSTGVTYSYSKERSRSRSAVRQELQPEKLRGSQKRLQRSVEHESGDILRTSRRFGRVRRSRSPSPVARVARQGHRVSRDARFRGRLGSGPSSGALNFNIQKNINMPNRGPWKHDMYGRDDDAREEHTTGRQRVGRSD